MNTELDIQKALKDLQSGQDLTGRNWLLTHLIKQLTEDALKAELEQHLEDEHQANRKNCSTRKTVKSSVCTFDLDAPRDCSGTFEPRRLVKKNQTKLTDEIGRKVLSMFSLGMSYRDMLGHVEDMYSNYL